MGSGTVELPLKPRQLHPVSKKNKSSSSASGVTGGKKGKGTPGMGLQIAAQEKKDAQARTKAEQRVMVLLPNGKRRFVKASELQMVLKK